MYHHVYVYIYVYIYIYISLSLLSLYMSVDFPFAIITSGLKETWIEGFQPVRQHGIRPEHKPVSCAFVSLLSFGSAFCAWVSACLRYVARPFNCAVLFCSSQRSWLCLCTYVDRQRTLGNASLAGMGFTAFMIPTILFGRCSGFAKGPEYINKSYFGA